MVSIPANVIDILRRPDSVKVLSTSSKEGMPHTMVCGSIFVPDAGTLGVGEVIMKVSSANMKENNRVSFLVISGAEAYQIDAVVRERQTEGPNLEELNVKLERKHLTASAVWLFDVAAVTVASASHEAGKRIA